MAEKLFAVTGNPILHSKSPVIFNNLFKQLRLPYHYFRLAADSAEKAISAFNSMGLCGMNVSAPFKADIMKNIDDIDESAQIIGGVNTVVKKDKKLYGYNTDFHGVVSSLKKNGIPLKNTNAIVLGAGGAGRAASYGLVKQGAKVTIVNRTVSKAQSIAEKLGCQFSGLDQLEALLKKTDLLISSLMPETDIVKKEWLNSKMVLFDANYKPSAISQAAMEKGCKIIKGEDWLLYQALPAFELYTGLKANDAVTSHAFDLMKNEGFHQKIILAGQSQQQLFKIADFLQKTIKFEITDKTDSLDNRNNIFVICDQTREYDQYQIEWMEKNSLIVHIEDNQKPSYHPLLAIRDLTINSQENNILTAEKLLNELVKTYKL